MMKAAVVLLLTIYWGIAQPQSRDPNAVDKWAKQILSAVESNWDKNALDKGQSCSVNVEQNRNGDVLAVTVVKSCGSKEADAAMLRAVWKSSPLPKPDDPSVFIKNISMQFSPE